MIPRIARPNAQPPHILPALIPTSMWGVNLRSLLQHDEWNRLRKECYRRANYHCEVCGFRPKKPHCNEQWSFHRPLKPHGLGVQKLVRLACLCPACHLVKHLGFASTTGRLEKTIEHMSIINGWTKEEGWREYDRAGKEWLENNAFDWTLDLTYLKRAYGVSRTFTPDDIQAMRRRLRRKEAGPAHELKTASLTPQAQIERRAFKVTLGKTFSCTLPRALMQLLQKYEAAPDVIEADILYLEFAWKGHALFSAYRVIALIQATEKSCFNGFEFSPIYCNDRSFLPTEVAEELFRLGSEGTWLEIADPPSVVSNFLTLREMLTDQGKYTAIRAAANFITGYFHG